MDNLDDDEAVDYLWPILEELYEDETGDMPEEAWRSDAARLVFALEKKGLFLATNLRRSHSLGLAQ